MTIPAPAFMLNSMCTRRRFETPLISRDFFFHHRSKIDRLHPLRHRAPLKKIQKIINSFISARHSVVTSCFRSRAQKVKL